MIIPLKIAFVKEKSDIFSPFYSRTICKPIDIQTKKMEKRQSKQCIFFSHSKCQSPFQFRLSLGSFGNQKQDWSNPIRSDLEHRIIL